MIENPKPTKSQISVEAFNLLNHRLVPWAAAFIVTTVIQAAKLRFLYLRSKLL